MYNNLEAIIKTYPDILFQGLGTALQIFKDFVPSPL